MSSWLTAKQQSCNDNTIGRESSEFSCYNAITPLQSHQTLPQKPHLNSFILHSNPFVLSLKRNFHTSTCLGEIKDERKIILDEKSKLEEFVEHQKKKRELNIAKMESVGSKLQEAFIYKPQHPEGVEEKKEKLPIKDRIMNELNHYYSGFKLLYLDSMVAAKLLWQVLNGETLSRRERRQVRCSSKLCA